MAVRENRRADAITAFAEHLSRRPGDGHAWLKLANLLKDEARLAEAEKAYDKAARLIPDVPTLWLNRGHLAKTQGRLALAKKHYRRSFEMDGNPGAGRELRSLDSGRDAPKLNRSGRRLAIVGRIDTLGGRIVSGWAVDPSRPEKPTEVEFLQDGRLVGRAVADISRADVALAGFGSSASGFRCRLNADYHTDGGPLEARLIRSRRALSNSPFSLPAHDFVSKWVGRNEAVPSASPVRTDTLQCSLGVPLLSIVMPVYDPPITWLKEAIESVLMQDCGCWELICVDDKSSNPEVLDVLSRFADSDRRIKVVAMTVNGGVSTATNQGLSLASADYVAFMDHDDKLEPEAVSRIVDAFGDSVDLIYSDEIITGENTDDVLEVVCRPSFSYDYYVSHPYFVHFIAVRRSIALEIGGLDETMSISMDVDFVLRVIENARTVAHVPAVLYRWRTHQGSSGHVNEARVMTATKTALSRHFARLGRPVEISDGATFNTYRTDALDRTGRILAIIPTKNRLDLIKPCVDSVLATRPQNLDILIVDHDSSDAEVIEYFSSISGKVIFVKYFGVFNYSKMNNDAAFSIGVDYDFFLFLNNDIEAIEPGWVEHMHGLCKRPDVGAVGALLLYGDGAVQHGGVVLGVGGPAEHAYRAEPYRTGLTRNPGYLSGMVVVRDYMAVTGACLMADASAFRAIGGFEEAMAVGFNDVDLCLRLRQHGLKVLYDGYAVLHHYESATRAETRQLSHPHDTALMAERWASTLADTDPFHHPIFGRTAPVSYVVAEDMSDYRVPRFGVGLALKMEAGSLSKTAATPPSAK